MRWSPVPLPRATETCERPGTRFSPVTSSATVAPSSTGVRCTAWIAGAALRAASYGSGYGIRTRTHSVRRGRATWRTYPVASTVPCPTGFHLPPSRCSTCSSAPGVTAIRSGTSSVAGFASFAAVRPTSAATTVPLRAARGGRALMVIWTGAASAPGGTVRSAPPTPRLVPPRRADRDVSPLAPTTLTVAFASAPVEELDA